MERIYRIALVGLLLLLTACAREEQFVILSTNDMHAQIDRFPRLATAVKQCRDTMPEGHLLLVDAGDRWTGNAFVDMAPTPGMPIIEMVNRLGYDVVTLGNHEFDRGQAFLARMIDSIACPVICSNLISDTCTFRQPDASLVLERAGLRIGLVGAVTNYEGPGHPAGKAESFAGLRFPDPQQCASFEAAKLRADVDLLVLLSHMGDDRDIEMLSQGSLYDVVIGGHTHVERDTMIYNTLLTQTGRKLKSVGVTRITLRDKKPVHVDYELIPLDNYEPDPTYQAMVDHYYADEVLNRPVGALAEEADVYGLGYFMAESIRLESKSDIGIYHVGGVRYDALPAGAVGLGTVYSLEPFSTTIVRQRMTPAQLRAMVEAKYNEPTREGHRIDLLATVPYTLITDAADHAVDVRFPTLQEGRAYYVAINNYIAKTYPDVQSQGAPEMSTTLVTTALLNQLAAHNPLPIDNTPRQTVEVR